MRNWMTHHYIRRSKTLPDPTEPFGKDNIDLSSFRGDKELISVELISFGRLEHLELIL